MSEFIKVAKLTEITPGTVRHFEVNSVEIALINLDGNIYAINDICTHKYCLLSGGYIEGENITCPCHLSIFEIKTGKVLEPPALEDVATYRVRIQEDDIEVDLNPKAS